MVKSKVEDVRGKQAFFIKEGKTRKNRKVNIAMLAGEIERYIHERYSEEHLLPSQKGNNHLTTTQVYRILESARGFLGREDIGTHTMRKTFGYHHYKQFKDVAILQEIFNHSSPSITKRYIGIRQDEIDKSLASFRLG